MFPMNIYDVAVIGSGLVGLSTAYELAKKGRKVALIDASGLSSGASSANTSLLLFEGETRGMIFDLCAESIAMYANLDEELGQDVGFETAKMICYINHEADFPEARRICDFYVENGFEYEVVDAPTLHKLEPELNMDGMLGGMYFTQWKMDPLRLVYAYFTKARQYGMDWYPYNKAIGFEQNRERILGVITEKGIIHAEQFVVATGAWTRELMLTLGIDIPEFYIQGAALVAERGGVTLNNAIYQFEPTRVQMEQRSGELAMKLGWENIPEQKAREFVIVQDSHGNIISAQSSMVIPNILNTVPPEFLRDMAANIKWHFPNFGHCKVIRSWICPVPFVPDCKPFFGFVQPYDNLLLASGFSSVLIMTPILGKLACSMLGRETISYDLRYISIFGVGSI
jgi:glycine/D-amino acid oxidase-like deaminating enzyme